MCRPGLARCLTWCLAPVGLSSGGGCGGVGVGADLRAGSRGGAFETAQTQEEQAQKGGGALDCPPASHSRMLCGRAFFQTELRFAVLVQEKDKHKKHKSSKKKKRRRQTDSDSEDTSSDSAAEGKRAKAGEKHRRDSSDREHSAENPRKKVTLESCLP